MAMGWAIHFKQESRNPFFLWILICTPIIYATIAYFLFRGGKDGQTLAAAAIGSAMMGIWSLTTTASAAALAHRRRVGLLELLVAAPIPFWAVLAPITIAISAVGIYSIATSLLYTRLLFGVALPIENWVGIRRRRPRLRSSRSGCSASCSGPRSSASAPPGRSATCSSSRCGRSAAS